MLPRIKISFERWKFNKDFQLWVSNKGRVLDRYKQEVRIKVNIKGYLVCWSEVKQTYFKIHRLVLSTWRPMENMKNLTIDHRDHNKRNNEVSNLTWVPRKENQEWATEDLVKETKTPAPKKEIYANGVAMTIEEAVTFIYELSSTSSQYSKVQVREKIEETLRSGKIKKSVFGITLKEIKK